MTDPIVQLTEKLQFIIEGGCVVRYHTRPGVRPDTDAHHSHGVAMLCYLLTGGLHPARMREYACTCRHPDCTDCHPTPARIGVSAALLMAALTHDLGEQKSGDIPSPTKRMLGITEQHAKVEEAVLEHYSLYFYPMLTPEERKILAWADMFDGMLYTCREIALGNRMMLLVYKRYRTYVQSIYEELSPEARNIFTAIQKIYKEYRLEPRYDVFTSTGK